MKNDARIERGDPIREKDPQTNAVPLDGAYERESDEPAELESPLPKCYTAMSLALAVWGAALADAGDRHTDMALAGTGVVDGTANRST